MEPHESIVQYITQCRNQGYSDADIQVALQQSGWLPEEIEQALAIPTNASAVATSPPQPLAEAGQPRTKKPFPKKAVGLTLAGIVGIGALGAGTIAFAEQGYLPAVSRVYRERAPFAPTLWGGTSGSPLYTLFAQVTQSTRNTGALTSTDSTTLTIDAPADVLASFDVQGPLTIRLDTKGSYAVDGGVSGEISLTSDLLAKLSPFLEQYGLQPITNTFVIAGQLDNTAERAYLASNIFAPTTATAKWLAFSIPADIAGEITKARKENLAPTSSSNPLDSLTEKEKEVVVAFLNEVITDQGIERSNGVPAAHYRLTLTSERLVTLSKDLLAANPTSQLAEVSTEQLPKFTLNGDVLVHQKDHTLLSQNFSVEVPKQDIGGQQIGLNLKTEGTYQYGVPATIPSPSAAEILSNDGAKYLEDKIQAAFPTTQTTTSLSDEDIVITNDSELEIIDLTSIFPFRNK